MTFQGEPGSRELLTAIQCFKDKDGAVDKTAPLEFLKPVEREAVDRQEKIPSIALQGVAVPTYSERR